MTGFEPATTRSQSDHSTRLNYIPITFQKLHLSGRASIWWLGSMSHPLFPFWNISLFLVPGLVSDQYSLQPVFGKLGSTRIFIKCAIPISTTQA